MYVLSAAVLALLAAPSVLAAPSFETDLEKRGFPPRCPKGRTAKSKGVPPAPNGCTAVPDGIFKGCCNTHDKCYANCGRSKLQCDSAFRTCMRSACDSHYPKWYQAPVKAVCKKGADTYYTGVAVGGDVFFKNANAKHCKCV